MILRLLIQLFCLFCTIAVLHLPICAQNYNGKGLMWELTTNTDARVSVKFGSTGINIGGYEGTTVIIKNVTGNKLYVEIKLVIIDYCGNETVRLIKEFIKANGTLGGSTWMGGSEQYDYDTKCKERKLYNNNFYSKIKNATLEIISIKELTPSGTPNIDKPVIGVPKPGDDTKPVMPPNSGGGGEINKAIASNCPPQGFALANTVGYGCVQLRWVSEATIQFNSQTNELRTPDKASDNFILQYKEADATYWKDINVKGYTFGYNLVGLDACTKYEVRLLRDCGNGAYSAPSNTIVFTTNCPSPSMVQVTTTTQNTIGITSRFSPGINICGGKPLTHTIVVEYKDQGTFWETVICNPGQGCILYNLKPNTSYRVRLRYEYPNKKFSKYSSEIAGKTKP